MKAADTVESEVKFKQLAQEIKFDLKIQVRAFLCQKV